MKQSILLEVRGVMSLVATPIVEQRLERQVIASKLNRGTQRQKKHDVWGNFM